MVELDSIQYMASLMDFISQYTRVPVSQIVSKIGEKGFLRLFHNSPMNELLPYMKIVKEIIFDYNITYRYPENHLAQWNRDYGEELVEEVCEKTSDRHDYAAVLYSILLEQR